MALLMPNLLCTQQVRIVAWFLLFWAAVIGIYVAKVIGFDLYVRTHWQVVEGAVIKYEEKSAQLGSIRSRRSTYWREFEVEFDPKGWRFPCLASSPCMAEGRWTGARSISEQKRIFPVAQTDWTRFT